MKKRVISIILMLALCITLIPSQGLTAASKSKVHVIQKGESLYKIAKGYKVSWRDIAKKNNIKPPYTIYTGGKLEIPTSEKAAATSTKKKTTTKTVQDKKSTKDTTDKKTTTVEQKEPDAAGFSDWAISDLLTGDSYGIYPLSWYETGLRGWVTKAQMNTLTTNLNGKLREADGVTKDQNLTLTIKDKMTVEEVLNTFYAVLSSNKYSENIGLQKRYTPLAFMSEYGIYTDAKEELKATDICTLEQACIYATRLVTYVYDSLNAGSKGFMWQVKKDGNTAYLLGSIHMANNEIYPFSSTMRKAYQESDALVVEVDLYNQDGIQKFTQLAYYSDGSTLADHISKDTYDKVVKACASLGYPENIIFNLKPWYLSNLFSSHISASTLDATEAAKATALGIDISFMSRAMLEGKPILEIEGYEFQGKLFDNFSSGLQEYLLINSMQELEKMQTNQSTTNKDDALLDKWLDNWHDGNIEAFKQSYNVSEEVLSDTFNETQDTTVKAYAEEYYNGLLTSRDKGMANYIDNLLQANGSKTYFVVVGSLHYLSDYSVLDILKEKGYEINQIK